MSTPWVLLVLALWVVVVALTIVVVGLLRRMGPVLEAAEQSLRTRATVPADLGGLPPGARVPDFRVTVLPDGDERPFADLLAEPLVALFVEQRCPACETLLDELSGSPAALGTTPLLILAEPAEAGALAPLAQGDGHIEIAVQHDREASRAFAQAAFPQAFAIGEQGVVVAQSIPSSVADLDDLAAKLREADRVPTRPLVHTHHPLNEGDPP